MPKQLKQNLKSKTIYNACIDTPFSRLGLRFENKTLVALDYLDSTAELIPAAAESSALCRQIMDYCSNSLSGMKFDVSVKTSGTVFQQKVWLALQTIPFGVVVTYGELAQRLNTSPRAVGNACRRNPVPLVIPCHRVVAKHGRGGYAGESSGRMLAIKNWLLDHEAVKQV